MGASKQSPKKKKCPSELKKEMLSTIRKTLREMASPQWTLTLETKTSEEQGQAAGIRRKLQQDKLRLENAALKQIRDAMIENEKDIMESTDAMRKALCKLHLVADVLSAGAKLITVVDRILKYV